MTSCEPKSTPKTKKAPKGASPINQQTHIYPVNPRFEADNFDSKPSTTQITKYMRAINIHFIRQTHCHRNTVQSLRGRSRYRLSYRCLGFVYLLREVSFCAVCDFSHPLGGFHRSVPPGSGKVSIPTCCSCPKHTTHTRHHLSSHLP